ncbi:MAG: hypothetical protein J5585_05970 [Clostridia bacterium]|nr:hypothetical protein [Clostridia bacterium]
MRPDVEVVFKFNGAKKHPIKNGYRPAHMVKENCLTTGIHDYYDSEYVDPAGCVKGTISFIDPEAYSHSLWVGKTLSIQEGDTVVGEATITRIFNSLLS